MNNLLEAMMAGLTPVGGTLGAQKFFEPKKAFIDWMVKEFKPAATPVFDVGAGMGHVSKALSEAGLRVFALDCNHRTEEVVPVYLTDGCTFPYPEDSAILLARPCHGPFVEAVIRQAIARKCSAVVYAGKPENVEDDLYPFRGSFQQKRINVGKEGEAIYVWRMRR